MIAELRKKLSHADPAFSWRKGFSCTAKSDSGKLERAATAADTEPANRLA